MKKNLLIVSVVLLLLLAGCSLFQGKEVAKNGESKSSEIEKVVSDDGKNESDSITEELAEGVKKDTAVYDIAKENGDLKSCDDILSKKIKADCEFDIVVKNATDKKDSKLCKGLENADLVNKCENQVAAAVGPPTR